MFKPNLNLTTVIVTGEGKKVERINVRKKKKDAIINRDPANAAFFIAELFSQNVSQYLAF